MVDRYDDMLRGKGPVVGSSTGKGKEEEGWIYPWQEEQEGRQEGMEADNIIRGRRRRVPSLLEHRFEVPLAISPSPPPGPGDAAASAVHDEEKEVNEMTAEEGQEGGGGCRGKEDVLQVVLSGVLDRVDLVYPPG